MGDVLDIVSPYEVMGTQELDGKNTNFIVIHDFFDTSEATGILFQRLVKRFVGCQVMVFNQPGQADSRWKPTPHQNNGGPGSPYGAQQRPPSGPPSAHGGYGGGPSRGGYGGGQQGDEYGNHNGYGGYGGDRSRYSCN